MALKKQSSKSSSKTLSKKRRWVVYIAQAQNGKLYTGITNDLEKRVDAHRRLKSGAKFFRSSPFKKLLYSEKAKDRSKASQREAEIKKLSRPQKLRLLSSP